MTSLPTRDYDAFLFDMDGTILTSIIAAERVWAAWAREHGLDVDVFLPTIHGKRSIDTVRNLGLPDIDVEAEAQRITQLEIEDVEGIEAIAGVAAFLSTLPLDRWAIVTSAPRKLAEARIAAAGLLTPPVMVAAEDVQRGKPAPDPFLLGAEKLGMRPEQCLVFEDTLAGLQAAEAAGMDSVVVTATHHEPLETKIGGVPDYDELRAIRTPEGRLRLQHTRSR